MSTQSMYMDSEASSKSSDSGPEGQGFSQVLRKPKQRKNQGKAWNLQYTLHTDLLGREGVTAHKKQICLPPSIIDIFICFVLEDQGVKKFENHYIMWHLREVS